MSRRSTTEEFILNAKRVHGDKYGYNDTKYVSLLIPVVITCPAHGEFTQVPKDHLRGSGCRRCALDTLGRKKIEIHKQKFISSSQSIHGSKYNYSKCEYTGIFNPVIIICSVHGEFAQKPREHLSGCGCPECGNECAKERISKSIDTFICEANVTHDNKYDYSNVYYKNNYTKITIVCPIHGDFRQTPSNHLSGRGCPVCTETRGEMRIRKYLQHLGIKFTPQHRFDECRDIKPLPFDFYLPDLNFCIEFDGLQHFIPIDIFGGVEYLAHIQYHDDIKNKFVHSNNIKLIRISHNDINNIDTILTKEILTIINVDDNIKK